MFTANRTQLSAATAGLLLLSLPSCTRYATTSEPTPAVLKSSFDPSSVVPSMDLDITALTPQQSAVFAKELAGFYRERSTRLQDRIIRSTSSYVPDPSALSPEQYEQYWNFAVVNLREEIVTTLDGKQMVVEQELGFGKPPAKGKGTYEGLQLSKCITSSSGAETLQFTDKYRAVSKRWSLAMFGVTQANPTLFSESCQQFCQSLDTFAAGERVRIESASETFNGHLILSISFITPKQIDGAPECVSGAVSIAEYERSHNIPPGSAQINTTRTVKIVPDLGFLLISDSALKLSISEAVNLLPDLWFATSATTVQAGAPDNPFTPGEIDPIPAITSKWQDGVAYRYEGSPQLAPISVPSVRLIERFCPENAGAEALAQSAFPDRTLGKLPIPAGP